MRAVREIFYTCVVLLFLPFVVLAVYLTIWLADREQPLTLHRMWVDKPVARPGEDLQLWIDRTAYRESGLNLEYFFTDAKGQSAPPIVYSTKSLRGQLGTYAYSVAIPVPPSFASGWATLERRVDYWRNPIHQYFWPIPGPSRRVKVCVIADDVAPEEVCKTSSPQPGE